MKSWRATIGLVVALCATCPAQSPVSPLIFTKGFGGSAIDGATALTVDSSGNVIAAGSTTSFDFPVTNGSANPGTRFAVSGDAGASWGPLSNPPSTGPLTALSLVADTSNPPNWYAAGATDLYKSVDGGKTWQTIDPTGLANCDGYAPSCGITALVVNPAQPSILYGSGAGGILETMDGGNTWSFVNAPESRNPPGYLALDPFHPSHLFTNINQNDYRSFDGGQNWTQFTPPLLHPGNYCGTAGTALVAFDAVTPNVVYMVDHCDLFVSTDGGIYWNSITGPFTLSYYVVTSPVQTGVIYVPTFTGLYASMDAGKTWNLLLANEQGNPPHLIAIDPQQPSILMTDSARSEDGGQTWRNLALGRPVQSVVFDPGGSGRVLAATEIVSTAFLTKMDGAGNILASTYFGGQGSTSVKGIAADLSGNIYVTGSTASPDFPAPPVPGASAYVAKLDSNLNLIWASLLAGQLTTRGIAVDPAGSPVVTGSIFIGNSSTCFAQKSSPDGSQSLFFTQFGGSNGDLCSAVAADQSGNSIIVGTTYSKDFPVAGNPPQTSLHGYSDAIIAKLDPSGNIALSGFLGGGDADSAVGVAADAQGNIYVAGDTMSIDFPTTAGAYQTALSSDCPYPSAIINTGFIGTIFEYNTGDAFITKLDPNGSLIFSTYLGGGCYDTASSMAVDGSGDVWLLGSTNSDPFPQAAPFQSGPSWSAYKPFLSELLPDGSALALSSYIDSATSIASAPNGAAYVAGSVATNNAAAGATGSHAWVAEVEPQPPAALFITSVGNAFNLRDGPVSPGQITLITADGIAPSQPVDLTLTPSTSLPSTLAGVQALFDGEAAPLVTVGNGFVVTIAPYDLAGKSQTAVEVVFQGAASPAMLADVHPDTGYRSADGSGTGQAYALNADGTLNSTQNPAAAGTQVTVYLTGIGIADPACPLGGVAATASTISVQGLLVASVPGSVCGLFQMAIKAPTYSTSFTLGQSQVTIAVH